MSLSQSEDPSPQATENAQAVAQGLPPPHDITSANYALPTPSWALVGSAERGFAPTETRVYKKGHGPEAARPTAAADASDAAAA